MSTKSLARGHENESDHETGDREAGADEKQTTVGH